MKIVDLIEVTAEELDGATPRADMELIIRLVRYRVVHVKPLPTRSSRRARPDTTPAPCTWKLLVEQCDAGTG